MLKPIRKRPGSMKCVVAIVLSSCLFVSCETPPSKQNDAGQNRQGELQSSHETGIWINDSYVDDLGQTSEREYIRNRDFISGSFRNAATPHSPLIVRFLIFDPGNISLQLFEYAGNNPVKALTPESYTVSIEDAHSAKHKLKAINYSDRLAFEKTDARTVHGILMSGGKIQFNITDDFNTRTEYQFTIGDASGYDRAYRNLVNRAGSLR